MGNAVVHFEFTTADPEALGKFYSDLFGWNAQAAADDYVLVDTASGAGINGGIMKGDNRVSVYLEAKDLHEALKKIEKLGGKTVVPPTERPMVTFAHFSDPAGNLIGLVKNDGTEGPGVSKGSNQPVDWFEILGKDGKGLAKFYSDAFGWKLNDTGAEGFDYFMLDSKVDGSPGAVGSPLLRERNNL